MATVDFQRRVSLPIPLSRLSEFVESRPEAFLAGDKATQEAALAATKYVFDLALYREKRARTSIAQLLRSIEPLNIPETRSQRKRKRSPSPLPLSPSPPQTDDEIWPTTPLESLYLDEMDDVQVWAQLELRATALCRILKAVLEVEEEITVAEDDSIGMQEEEDLKDLGNLYEDPEEDSMDTGDNGEEGYEEGLDDEVADLRYPSDEGSEEDEGILDLDRPTRPSLSGMSVIAVDEKINQHSILDDAFFSLAEFNGETEEAEAKVVSNGRLDQEEQDHENNDEEGDFVDLFANINDVGADAFEEDDLEEYGEPYYQDFFDPPRNISSARRTNPEKSVPNNKPGKVRFKDEVRVKKIRSHGKGNPVTLMERGMLGEDDEEDEDKVLHEGNVELGDFSEEDSSESKSDVLEEGEQATSGAKSRETIERLKDDLFAEEDDTPFLDLSTHETRQAEITAQIAELEAKSVATKEWILMGEATSRSRPVNSLLEEDLEFDRVMKVVPVVTEERVSGLEELIKKRILDNRFDDVIRRRPVDEKPFLPSSFFELNDQKPAQSLAQIYEDDYSTTASGKIGADDRDGKLKKEHAELEEIWEKICHKLDALSNAHFTPKQPKATISTVSNLPTTGLESALPPTKAVTTMLAPEEIFSAPSEIRSRGELTPVEKQAQRNKQRKARRKAKDRLAASIDKYMRTHKPRGSAGNTKEKEKALKSVVKTGKGVTIVGKKSAELKRQSREKDSTVPIDGRKLKL